MVDNEKCVQVSQKGAERLYDAVFALPYCARLRSELGIADYPNDLWSVVAYLLEQPAFNADDMALYDCRYEWQLTDDETSSELHIPIGKVQSLEKSFLSKMRTKSRILLLMFGIKRFQLLADRLDIEKQLECATASLENLQASIAEYRQATSDLIAKQKELEEAELPEARSALAEQLRKLGMQSLKLLEADPYASKLDNTLIDVAFPTLSARSRNALVRSDIVTIGQLKKQSYASLRRIRNLGEKSRLEIMKQLKAYDGSVLAGTPPEIALHL